MHSPLSRTLLRTLTCARFVPHIGISHDNHSLGSFNGGMGRLACMCFLHFLWLWNNDCWTLTMWMKELRYIIVWAFLGSLLAARGVGFSAEPRLLLIHLNSLLIWIMSTGWRYGSFISAQPLSSTDNAQHHGNTETANWLESQYIDCMDAHQFECYPNFQNEFAHSSGAMHHSPGVLPSPSLISYSVG